MEIELEKIYVEEQPRKQFEDIEELSASILKNGLLEPLKVVKKGSKYKLVDGERRFKALKLIKEKKAECIILDNKQDNPIVQLAYDVSKRKLTIMEEANAFKKLIDGGLDIYELSARLGVNVNYVSRRMKLFALTSRTRELIEKKVIPASEVIDLDFSTYKEHENAINERIDKEVGFVNTYKKGEKIRRIIKEETQKEEGVIDNFLSDLRKMNEIIDNFNFKIQDFKIQDFKIQDYFGENLLMTITKLEKTIDSTGKIVAINNNLNDCMKRLKELRIKYGVGAVVDNKIIKEFVSSVPSEQKEQVGK